MTLVTHNFPPEYLTEFEKVIQEFSTLFNTHPLQQTTAEVHQIELSENKITNVPQYKLSPSKEEFAKKQIKYMLEQDLIEESTSPYNAPIVVVEYTDSNKEPRFCTDFKKLNQITKDSYCASLNITNLVKNVKNNKFFLQIELSIKVNVLQWCGQLRSSGYT